MGLRKGVKVKITPVNYYGDLEVLSQKNYEAKIEEIYDDYILFDLGLWKECFLIVDLIGQRVKCSIVND